MTVGADGSSIYANRVANEYMGLTLEEYRTVDLIGSRLTISGADKP
jgi:hypothetical protein